MNIRQLRDTRRLKKWLNAGQTVDLLYRQNVIAHIVPVRFPIGPEHWPDFARRRQKIFGRRVLPGADLLIEERG